MSSKVRCLTFVLAVFFTLGLLAEAAKAEVTGFFNTHISITPQTTATEVSKIDFDIENDLTVTVSISGLNTTLHTHFGIAGVEDVQLTLAATLGALDITSELVFGRFGAKCAFAVGQNCIVRVDNPVPASDKLRFIKKRVTVNASLGGVTINNLAIFEDTAIGFGPWPSATRFGFGDVLTLSGSTPSGISISLQTGICAEQSPNVIKKHSFPFTVNPACGPAQIFAAASGSGIAQAQAAAQAASAAAAAALAALDILAQTASFEVLEVIHDAAAGAATAAQAAAGAAANVAAAANAFVSITFGSLQVECEDAAEASSEAAAAAEDAAADAAVAFDELVVLIENGTFDILEITHLVEVIAEAAAAAGAHTEAAASAVAETECLLDLPKPLLFFDFEKITISGVPIAPGVTGSAVINCVKISACTLEQTISFAGPLPFKASFKFTDLLSLSFGGATLNFTAGGCTLRLSITTTGTVGATRILCSLVLNPGASEAGLDIDATIVPGTGLTSATVGLSVERSGLEFGATASFAGGPPATFSDVTFTLGTTAGVIEVDTSATFTTTGLDSADVDLTVRF